MTVEETTTCFIKKLESESLNKEIDDLKSKYNIDFDITYSVYHDNHFNKTTFSLTPDNKIPQEIKDFYKSAFDFCL